MSNVPSHPRTRRSHRRTLAAGDAYLGSRRSHSLDGYLPPLSGAEEVYQQISVDESGQITEGRIAPQSLSKIAQFARNIRPVVLVDVLPTLPDALYPPGSYVSLTTESPLRLYKNEAEVWVAGVGPNDIQANSITAAQIASGAISTDELAAGAITAGKLAVGHNYNLCPNPSFEYLDAAGAVLGWTNVAANYTFDQLASGNARTGSVIGRLTAATGAAALAGVQTDAIPVTAGGRYLVRGWVWKGALSGAAVRLSVNSFDKNGAFVSNLSSTASNTSTTPAQVTSAVVTIPSDGTVSSIKVKFEFVTAPAAGEIGAIEDIEIMRVADFVTNPGAEVTIDSTGITVENGRFILKDEFGSTAMEASGFTGTWRDFLGHGVYNAAFAAGTNGALTLGRTSMLPYWTVARDNAGSGNPTFDNTGSATLTRAADTTMPGGFRIRCAFGAVTNNAYVNADLVPVIPGKAYASRVFAGFNRSAGTLAMAVFVYWYKQDGTTLVSFDLMGTTPSIAVTTAGASYHMGAVVAPALARYAKLVVQSYEETTHHASNSVDVGAASFYPGVGSGDVALTAQIGLEKAQIVGPSGQNALEVLGGDVRFTGDMDFGTGAMAFGGSTFPSSPATNTLYYRTDRAMWFRYDGTRWVCTCPHLLHFASQTAVHPLAVTSTNNGALAFPTSPGMDILIESYDCLFNVSSGGSALDGSNNWVATINRRSENSGVATLLSTLTIDSGSSNVYRSVSDTADDVVDANGGVIGLTVTWTKTGTPGDLRAAITVQCRYIG